MLKYSKLSTLNKTTYNGVLKSYAKNFKVFSALET